MTDTVRAPWDFAEAAQNSRNAQARQQMAEDRLKDAFREFAEAEEVYRLALAKKILVYKSEGFAITACSELARGDREVASLRRQRDIAEGVREAAQSSLWRHNANRKDVLHFSEWSQRREQAEAAI